jgi:hypothetical protein
MYITIHCKIIQLKIELIKGAHELFPSMFRRLENILGNIKQGKPLGEKSAPQIK